MQYCFVLNYYKVYCIMYTILAYTVYTCIAHKSLLLLALQCLDSNFKFQLYFSKHVIELDIWTFSFLTLIKWKWCFQEQITCFNYFVKAVCVCVSHFSTRC